MKDADGVAKRLNELKSLNLIDSGSEDEYDSITSLATFICGTPIALITILTDDRQYFKSHHGLELEGSPIVESFCAHAILTPNDITVIEDARLDPRFKANPQVTGYPGIVFYAGVPLVTGSGIPIGTLCVIDKKANLLNSPQIVALKALASQVVRLIEFRKTRIDLRNSQLELADESVRLRNIIEATRIGTWEWNVQSDQIYINDRYAEIAGYTKAELEPINIDTWYKLIHPDDRLLSDTAISDCFEKKADYYDIECRLVHKNGHVIWVNDRGRVMSWTDDGKPLVMSGTHTEITAKKSAELRLSQTLDTLKERIKEQTSLYRISRLYENTVDIDELLGKAVNIIPSGWRYSRNAHARIKIGDKVFTSNGFTESAVLQEFSRYTIDGNILQLSVFYDSKIADEVDSPFIVEEWDLIRMIVDNLVLFYDRKLADLRIAQNENRYRILVENGADAIAIISADGATKYVSPSITRVLGYTEAEAMKMNLFELVHPDDVDSIKSFIVEVLDNPAVPMQGHTSRALHKDGSWRWLEATVTNLIHDPAINGIVDNFRDVTDRVISNKLDVLERSVMELTTDIKFDLSDLLQRYSSGLEDILPDRVFGDSREPKLPVAVEKEIFKRSAALISLIKESYKKNQELLASNERYHYVNLATNDAIYDWDVVSDVFNWGESFTRIFGHELSETPFRLEQWEQHMHPDDNVKTVGLWDEFWSDPNQHIWRKEFRFQKSDDSYAYVEETGYLIRDDKGKPKRMIGVLRDRTSQKEQEESLRQLNQKLEMHAQELAVSNRELEQFAYIASHDLQEPLRMITSFMGQLEKKYGPTLDDKAKKYIFYATDGAKRMRQIILDLLEYSRVGKFEYKVEIIPLNDLINEVLHLDQNLIIEKSARITISNLPTIECYRPPLLQIFHNLIVNAIKYNRPGVPPDIEISATSSGSYWVISVKDNGIGINSEYFDKIFIIFQRLHSPGEYEGTGLGLAIVKKVVESLGGKISVTSEVGKGSNFKVMLPKRCQER
jgi:PAS domain S-box-containing protein